MKDQQPLTNLYKFTTKFSFGNYCLRTNSNLRRIKLGCTSQEGVVDELKYLFSELGLSIIGHYA